jgi:hypothetical protein
MITFHLSVNRHGTVSLWDREEQARGVSDEVYLALRLNPWQEEQVKDAQKAAQRKAPKE